MGYGFFIEPHLRSAFIPSKGVSWPSVLRNWAPEHKSQSQHLSKGYLSSWLIAGVVLVLCPPRGQGERGSAHTPKAQSTPAASGPRSPMAHRPATPPTRRRRQRAHGANSHTPRLQLPSSTPLRSGGLPLWATALSPEPGPRGRTQLGPATPAPKPRPTSPSALQPNAGTRKMTRERNVSCAQPSRQPSAGGATDAQTPTPPAACDRNALSAL